MSFTEWWLLDLFNFTTTTIFIINNRPGSIFMAIMFVKIKAFSTIKICFWSRHPWLITTSLTHKNYITLKVHFVSSLKLWQQKLFPVSLFLKFKFLTFIFYVFKLSFSWAFSSIFSSFSENYGYSVYIKSHLIKPIPRFINFSWSLL